VPVLAEYRTRNGEAETRLLVDRVATALSLAVLVVSILAFSPRRGSSMSARPDSPPRRRSSNSRWRCCASPFPTSCSSRLSLCRRILNTWSRFAVPAFTPTLLNLSFIFCALVLAPYFQPPVLVLAWAVLAAACCNSRCSCLFWRKIGMLPRLRPDFFRPWPAAHPQAHGAGGVRRFDRPTVAVINTIFASFLANGSVSWLYYADRLMEFPTGMLGVALGTILLPSLSKYYSSDSTDQYSRLLDWGLRLTLLLALRRPWRWRCSPCR